MSVSCDELCTTEQLSSPSQVCKDLFPSILNSSGHKDESAPHDLESHTTQNSPKPIARVPKSNSSTPSADNALSSASSTDTDSINGASHTASLDVTLSSVALTVDPSSNVNAGLLQAPSLNHTSQPSGKLRASTPGCASHVINRLPQEVIGHILSHIGLYANSAPAHLPQSSMANVVVRVLGWRNYMLGLRRLSRTWKDAVDNQDAWMYYAQAFRRGTSQEFSSSTTPFIRFDSILRSSCVACYASTLRFVEQDATEKVFTSQLGHVKFCKYHARSAGEGLRSSAVCFHCLQSSEHQATYDNTDMKSFGLALNVCKFCRAEAFHKNVDIICQDRLSFESQFRQSVSYKFSETAWIYVQEGEGTAHDAAVAAVNNCWLESYTSYAEVLHRCKHFAGKSLRDRKHAFLLRQEQRRRATRAFVSGGTTEEIYEFSDEEEEEKADLMYEEEFEYEDGDESTDWKYHEDIELSYQTATSEALKAWCRHRLNAGIYQSVQEQRAKAWIRAGHPYWTASGRPLPVRRHAPERPPLEPTTLASVMLPPPTMAARMTGIMHSNVLPAHFHDPLRNIVEMLRNEPNGLEIASAMTPDGLLERLRNWDVWTWIELGADGRARRYGPQSTDDYPCVPASASDVGEMTMWRLMDLFREACKPLEVCSCGICARQKRKRSPTESPPVSASPSLSPTMTMTNNEEDAMTLTDHSMTPDEVWAEQQQVLEPQADDVGEEGGDHKKKMKRTPAE